MTTLRLLLFLLAAAPLCAQRNNFPPTPYSPTQTPELLDPTTLPQPKLIALAGVTTQWASPRFKAASFALEHPVNIYHHLGIQANMFAPGFVQESYYTFCFPGSTVRQGLAVERGSFEVGIYYKNFFHGRFTGRKSSLYFGPDLRFGWRNYTDDYVVSGVRTPLKGRTTKYLARLGAQHSFGNALIEVTLPIGIESEKSTRVETTVDPCGNGYINLDGERFVMLPSISLGYSLYTPKSKGQGAKSKGQKAKGKKKRGK